MTEPVSEAESDTVPTRCGYVALAGRPNVGKSTLMNHLLGRKLSITSRKPQTTRQALIGVLTRGDAQIVFVDTPGIHIASGRALNRYMVGQAVGSLAGVELALMLVEASGWHDGDEIVRRRIHEAGVPCICVINKIDRLRRKERLLPLIDALSRKHDFEALVPVSALKNLALDELLEEIVGRLPRRVHMFAADEVTDRSLDFLVGEIVREKAIRRLGAELPHQTAVMVDRISVGESLAEVDAVIYVERDTQKRIAIGKGGAMLKSIGEDARKDIEFLIGSRAMVRLWVKVDRRWSGRPDALQRFGYQSQRSAKGEHSQRAGKGAR
ncbi:MAG: GTPase Era [Gammaproteobacteria bacterium]|nr:GTPase Era [Gammaproteobacteria bacterium]MXY57505.1 GTPase Era [Gammaproteobacteria bacterium]MYF29764.1 GTPase Era [Gammaproteobacteria bacterium]